MADIWHFEALDTLFFRDSRPMNSGETVWIDSQFPPTGRTLQGAIRTAVLSHLGVSFSDYLNKPDQQALQSEIGNADGLGNLKLTGPRLVLEGKTYFPVPFDLMKNTADGSLSFALLKPSAAPTTSDLGNIRFPALDVTGYKNIADTYIDEEGMALVLQGKTDDLKQENHLRPLVSLEKSDNPLIYGENRIGLARNNQTRMAEDGKLYALAPVRPIDNLDIAIQVQGLSEKHCPQGPFIQRLGGEGRMARVEIKSAWTYPQADMFEDANGQYIQFKLVCITPADFSQYGWLPGTNLQQQRKDGVDSWQITKLDCTFEVLSACIGKPFKQGGWDHAKRCPRELRAYIPAGSVYFCRADISQKKAIQQLHTQKLGSQTEYGFGQVLVGRW